MVEPRPDADALRDLVLADLSRMFRVQDVDLTGFTLERDARRTRVQLSTPQIETYITDIEDSAYEAIGIEPRWKSGVSLTAVHVMEEVAMAAPGMSVVVDGTTIRREPPPG